MHHLIFSYKFGKRRKTFGPNKSKKSRLEQAEQDRDTTRYWKLITAAAEEAYVSVLKLEGKQAEKMKGRADIKIRSDGGKVTMPIRPGTTAIALNWSMSAISQRPF